MDTTAAYIRVSTDKQDELSPDAQLRLLKEYAQAHDLLLPEEYIFWEIGVSGRKAERRPEFLRMISLAKNHPSPFQYILVWKFSRFARNQEESIVYKSLLQKESGVQVISASEPLVEGPFGSLIERIIEWMDEYYSIRLSGEVLRGMTEKALRGEIQWKAPFGYQMQNGHLIPDSQEAPIVRRIFHDYLAGQSPGAIARSLNSWGCRTKKGSLWERRAIVYILQNPVYAGILRFSTKGPISHKNAAAITNSPDIIYARAHHEPLLCEAEYREVQTRMQKNYIPSRAKAPSAGLHKHYLSGLLYCGHCGTGMTYANRSSSPCFRCRAYARGQCTDSSYLSLSLAVQCLLTSLNDFGAALPLHTVRISQTDTDLRLLLSKQLRQEEARLRRARDAYLAGIDTQEEYLAHKTEGETHRQHLQDALSRLSPAASPPASLSDLLRSSDWSMEEKHDALHAVVDHILWDRTSRTFSIYYRL